MIKKTKITKGFYSLHKPGRDCSWFAYVRNHGGIWLFSTERFGRPLCSGSTMESAIRAGSLILSKREEA